MTLNDILEKTFRQMPERFTSIQFAKQLRKNGGDNSIIRKGYIPIYLDYVADHNGSARSWVKAFKPGPVPYVTHDIDRLFKIVCDYYRFDISCKSHRPIYVRARRVFIYLAGEAGTPDKIIASYVNRDRTAVYSHRIAIPDLITPVNGSGYIPDDKLMVDIEAIKHLTCGFVMVAK